MSSDFQNFLVLDLETSEKIAFPLTELPQRLELFGWIAGYQRRSFAVEDEVNVPAAELMGRLYDLRDETGYRGHDLALLLVRLVLIMFPDDTSVWEKNRFTDHLVDRTAEDGADLGPRLSLLFQVLDTPKSQRQTSLDGVHCAAGVASESGCRPRSGSPPPSPAEFDKRPVCPEHRLLHIGVCPGLSCLRKVAVDAGGRLSFVTGARSTASSPFLRNQS